MNNNQTSKERKHKHTVIVCSIIGRKNSPKGIKCKIYFTPGAYQIETMIAKSLEDAIKAFKIKYPNADSVEKA